jgi:acyl carrier protein
MNEPISDELLFNIQQLVAQALQLPVEQVPPGLSFGDLLQWDSMGHMEVMLLLEEQYGVEIRAETISSLTSIPEICAHLAANYTPKENGHG